ncbi:AIR synthase-related protein [Acinetobacter boissieri]
MAIDSAVMNIDDMLCVGVTDGFLLSNTIGRNGQRVSGDVLKSIIRGYRNFAEKMTSLGVNIRLCGGETADVGDLVKSIMVDSTVYARFPRDHMIDCNTIQPEQAIVGLASFGKATYEDHENSGIASNGFTVARHALLHSSYAEKHPETFSETLTLDQVYRGPYHLSDALPNSNFTVAEALLSPTRSYAPIIKEILEKHRKNISGIIHCTGGALTKCLHFGENIHYIKNNLFEKPAVFQAIQESAHISDRDMWKIFNCGHRMEIYCDKKIADDIVAISKTFNVDAKIIGETKASVTGKNELTVEQYGVSKQY